MATRKNGPVSGPRLIGYARVSTREQTLQMQIDALLREGVMHENLHVEKVSGISSRRPKLELALMDAREGDTFVVWRLDRLSRSVLDLYTKVREMEAHGVKFRALNGNVDTSTATGKLFFGILAVMAEFERDLTIERTKSGMAAARERGRMPGHPPKMTPEVIAKARKLLRTKTVAEVAQELGVSDNTIYTRFPSSELEKLRSSKR